MFYRLKDTTDNKKLQIVLGDYADTMDNSFESYFTDAAKVIMDTWKKIYVNSSIDDFKKQEITPRITHKMADAEMNSGSRLIINNADVYASFITSTGDATIDGKIKVGTMTHQKGTLTINGEVEAEEFNQTDGVVQANGTLRVNGDYAMTNEYNSVSPRLNISGRVEVNNYISGYQCVMKMLTDEAYMLVNGNMDIKLSYYRYAQDTSIYRNILDKGTTEVKGNIILSTVKIDSLSGTGYGYASQGTHKTILSGDKEQKIDLYSETSHFNNLEIRNTSEEGVSFEYAANVLSGITQPKGTVLINPEKVTLQNKPAFIDYGAELNKKINMCVGNSPEAVPTWLDYENYLKTQVLSLKFENAEVTGNQISGNIVVSNNKENYDDAVLIIGIYDSNKRLESLDVVPLNIKYGEDKNYGYMFGLSDKSSYMRAFVWSSPEEMCPLGGAEQYDLQN